MPDEESCAPISYVYGGVTVSPKPPGNFIVGVRVSVGIQIALLSGPEIERDHILWHFLAVIKPGPAKVVCTVGDVTSTRNVETKSGQTSIVNFCFGKPVDSMGASGLPKARARRREQEKPQTDGSPGKNGVQTVP
jgi:hypothetical protein